MYNRLKSMGLLGLMTALLVAVATLMGGPVGFVFALGVAALMNVVTWWFSDRIVLHLHRARPAVAAGHPELQDMVAEVAALAGLRRTPTCYITSRAEPNAFATGRSPERSAVVLTRGLIDCLNQDELKGVISHELAHIQNRDVLVATIAAVLAGAVSMLSHQPGRRGLRAYLGGMAASFAALMVRRAVSRSREYVADETGARWLGTGKPLAMALRKIQRNQSGREAGRFERASAHMFIVSPFSGTGMEKLFSTHPPVDERIERLLQLDLGPR